MPWHPAQAPDIYMCDIQAPGLYMHSLMLELILTEKSISLGKQPCSLWPGWERDVQVVFNHVTLYGDEDLCVSKCPI